MHICGFFEAFKWNLKNNRNVYDFSKQEKKPQIHKVFITAFVFLCEYSISLLIKLKTHKKHLIVPQFLSHTKFNIAN